MAMVLTIGGRMAGPAERPRGIFERIFEQPFFDAEIARVEISRAEHPNQVNEDLLNVMFAWAVLYLGVCSYWFVKYII